MLAMMCSIMSVCAAPSPVVPVGCPLKEPCATEKPCPTTCEQPYLEEDMCTIKQRFLDKRCDLYQRLCLSDSQIEQAKCLDEKFFADFYPLKKCYCDEKRKLKEMECNKACDKDIKCQKEKVRDLKKQIKEKKKSYKANFMCILNECQKKKFKKMKKDKCKNKKDECACENTYECACGCE